MRAALLRELGGIPEPGEAAEPRAGDGEVLVEIETVALNPLDISVGSGRFYGGSPVPPYVPGCEAVGRLATTGRRVYVGGGGLGVRRNGTLAQRVPVADAATIPLPDDVTSELAVACGIAGVAGWLPLAWRAPVRVDDRLLVLGATGTAGLVAVQAGRLLGAERIVAAGRNAERLARAREVGADETVELGAEDAEAFRRACGGDGPTLIFDALWSEPVAAAVEAAAPGARLVQVGQSAGPEATLRSNDVRGKQLELLGYSNFAAPPDVARAGYLELLGHVTSGRIRLDVETFTLGQIDEAWRRQAEGPGAKVVVRVE